MLRSLTVTLLLVPLIGCLDSDPVTDDESQLDDDDSAASLLDADGDGYTEQTGDCDDSDASIHPGAEETCDGADNDCDGQTDEGFGDVDGDGISDCEDDDCDPGLLVTAPIGLEESCPWDGSVSAADPWDVVLEWSFSALPSYGTEHQPVVVNLTNDNEDSVIDENDVPDIVFGLRGSTDQPSEHRVVALHGDGSGVIFDVHPYVDVRGMAAGDIDGDGLAEILVSHGDYDTPGQRTVALTRTGAVLWDSPYYLFDTLPHWTYFTPTITDLEGDGSVEVVAGWAILDGATGQVEYEFDDLFGGMSVPVVADLDLDGTAEIVLADKVYSHTGAVEWTLEDHYPPGPTWFTAVGELDGDPEGEVAVVSGHVVSIHDEDGTLLRSFELDAPFVGGPPSLADFDGDGGVELAVPFCDSDGASLNLVELDGSVVWEAPIDDRSCAAGCSAFDFDADGVYEVVFSGDSAVRILDGPTGVERFLSYDHDSVTIFEYAVVADVDADGSAEIVAPCSWPVDLGPSACRGIQIFGHADHGWPPAGPTWSVHDYAPGRLRTDGQVDAAPPAWWNSHNMFRARPPGDGRPDLFPLVADVCAASCLHGPIQVSWGIGNEGHVNVPGMVSVAAYGLDGALLALQSVQGPQYGWQGQGGVFELSLEQWGDGIRIVVDDDGSGSGEGSVEECDETDNAVEIIEWPCE